MVISTLSLDNIIYLLDMIGIVACAVAGTVLAMKKGFDFFGCVLVSMVNAIGGGTVRDVILDRHPLFWTLDLSYLYVITLTSLFVQLFISCVHLSMQHLSIDKPIADIAMLGVIFAVRMLAIRFDWHLPSLGGRF